MQNRTSSRPRESQIGDWVSEQSKIVPTRNLLLQKFEQMRQKFQKGQIGKLKISFLRMN